ncbi:MAG TPA: GntR family transcriptional regulator [Patescibacteria group bacterium]|nr:GntR family transcriptional regulator [Patescibacteria group bacterium]
MSVVSKVDNIIDSLRLRILAGEFDGGKLPSFRKLVVEYKTSQETMNKAMQTLQAEGLLLSAGAKGVFTDVQRIRMPGLVAHFFRYLETAKLEGKGEMIGKPEIITPSEEIAERMHLEKNEKVLYRKRRQGTIHSPFRLVDGYYPMSLISDSMLAKIYKDPYFHISEAIEKEFGLSTHFVHEEIIARLPTGYEQENLKIVRTNPVIEAKFINYSGDKKKVIVYNEMILNANHFLLSYDYDVDLTLTEKKKKK